MIKFKFYPIGVFLEFQKEEISDQVISLDLPEDQQEEFRNKLNLLLEELVCQR